VALFRRFDVVERALHMMMEHTQRTKCDDVWVCIHEELEAALKRFHKVCGCCVSWCVVGVCSHCHVCCAHSRVLVLLGRLSWLLFLVQASRAAEKDGASSEQASPMALRCTTSALHVSRLTRLLASMAQHRRGSRVTEEEPTRVYAEHAGPAQYIAVVLTTHE